jgi:hypothetical protein
VKQVADHIEPGTLEADKTVGMVVAGNIGLVMIESVLLDLAAYSAGNHQIHFVFSSLNDIHLHLSCYIISLCELLLLRTSSNT